MARDGTLATDRSAERRRTGTDPGEQTVSRRSFLGGVVAAGGSAAPQAGGNQTGGNQTAGTQTEGGGDVQTHFEFGGRVEGWQGRAPSAIDGAVNPTLNLQTGRQYRVTWENLDGQPHNFVVQDADGNRITGTETVSEEGATLSLTFTASEEMAQYICTIHPSSMVGDLRFGGGGGGGGDEQNGFGPAQLVGTMAAVTIGFVVGFSYLLARYFDEYDEP